MSINLNVNGNTAPLEAAVQAAVNRIRKTPIKVTVDDKGATQPLGNMKRGADEFSKSMEAANARIIAFGASMAIINGISDAFKAMVTNVVQVEKALADINVVMGLSLANLDKFSDSLFKVAKETAASFDVAAAAATEYARQGLAVEETLKRTKDALILTRLTGMDSANAVKALTAAMNTYGDQIKDTTQLVSKFAAVDVKFAVSAEDFADAISRTGQAAKSAGVDIDELVGLVTAAQQKTARGGKVIGNSFKTIFTRIGRTDTLNQLENLGIAVRDVEGNTIGAKRILTDLANTFDSLTESQKAQIAQTVGGVFQINVLKAVLSDAAKQNGILANATQISAGATDEAIQKNEQLRSTMSAMASETGLALKEVSAKIGELAIAPGMEKILNIVKGFAEGASDMLGDGESSGNKFATGFLKGLGNIITGPGLVVIVAVFGKLFLKAAQYARESLSSLIGVTSEAQKQKAIQTSLVTLFGQNAALSKEMLRTDISRTEKERIILGLLKAQVVEANALNTIARSSAANLYQKGYGSNLAPRGKPRRTSAQGYIPNYVDAERQQAAQGGYAAGSIRSMNMPGEGSVIYNSAEKVKNFKGMSQPAIMPPKSSKAGENYQQAFDSIHGFDPYAAGGYIPNFFSDKEIGKKNAKKAKTVLNAENKIILLTANYPGKDLDSKTYWVRDAADKEAGTGTRVHSGVNTLRGSLTGKSFGKGNFKGKNKNAKPGGTQIDNVGVDMRQVKVPTFSLDKSESRINLPRNKSFQNYAYDKLKKYGKNLTIDMANRLMPGQKIDKFKNNQNAIEDSDVAVMGGRIFEKVLEAITEEIKGLSGGHKGALLDVPANPKLFKVFGAKDGDGSIGAEAKISSDEKHVKSAARKIFDVLSKTEDRGKQLEKAFPAKKAGTTLSKTSQIRKSGGNAYGHIPNFAAARLALTGGLVGKNKFGNIDRRQMTRLVRSNPYFNGLMNEHLTWDSFPKKDKRKLSRWLLKQGVSNRALQAYGLASMHSKSIGEGISNLAMAKGYIPNFADPLSDAIGREKEAGVPVSKIRIGSHPALMGKSNPVGLGVTNTDDEPNGLRDVFGAANGYVPNYFNPWENLKSSVKNSGFGQSWDKATVQHTKEIQRLNARIKQREQALSKHNQELSALTKGTSEYNAVQKKIKTTTQNLDKTRQKLTITEKSSASGLGGKTGRFSAGLGKAFSGNSGMMMMMGAPMAAGFLQQGGMGAQGGNQNMYAAGGALSGAASGAMMASMVAPMFGPGAPLVIGIGGLIGAFKGLTDANQQNTKALKEVERERKQLVISSFAGADPKFMQKFSKNIFKDLSPEGKSVMKMTAPKFTATKPVEVSEKDILTRSANNPIAKMRIPFLSPMFSPSDEERSQAAEYSKQMGQQSEFQKVQEFQTNSMKKALRSMGDQEFLLPNYEKDKSGKIQTKGSPELKKASVYLDNLEKIGFFEAGKVNDSERIEGLRSRLYEIYQADLVKEKDRSHALILQLDLQKVQVAAQQAAAMNQLKIKDKYSKIADDLSFEQKIMGSFATDLQKSQNKYLTSMNKAKEALAISGAKADDALRSDVQVKLKTGEYSDIELELKKKLFGDSAGEKTDQDVTNAMASKSGKELIAILEEIKDKNTKNKSIQKLINELIDSSIVKQKNALEIANKIFTNKEGQAKKEKVINDILAKRKQYIDEINRGVKKYSDDLKRDQTVEDFEDKLAKSQRLTAFGPGYKSGRERENFQMREKEIDLEKKLNKIRGTRSADILKLDSQKAIAEKGDADMLKLDKQITNETDPFADLSSEIAQYEALKKSAEERQKVIDDHEGSVQRIKDTTDAQITTEEKLLDLEKQRLENKRKHETGSGSFGRGLSEGMSSMAEQVETMDYELGTRLPQTFANGLSGAFIEAINGAKDLDDALREAGLNFLKMIQEAMMQKMVMQMMGGLGFSQGGNVRNYSKGGNVPARVSNGEYLMSREAVNKYGGSFMHGLNARGKAPGFSSGGRTIQPGSALAANFGGAEGYKSGKRYQSQAMSSFFYSGQSGNPGLREDTDEMSKILAEREQARLKAEAEAKAKKQEKRAMWGMLAGIVATSAASSLMDHFSSSNLTADAKADGYTVDTPSGVRSATKDGYQYSLLPGASDKGFDNVSKTRSWNPFSWGGSGAGASINERQFQFNDFQASPNYGVPPDPFGYKDPRLAYFGGKIGNYANGGPISGKSGIDQIPAMLSEGEYVVKASSARQIGRPMLDQINAGKFYDGGQVSTLSQNSESSVSGGNTNNINISVNIENGTAKESNENSKDQDSKNQDSSSESKIAQKIKQQVVAVIIEEQRIGGLLNKSK